MLPVTELSFQLDYSFESPQVSFFMPHRESWAPQLTQASADTVGEEDKEGLTSEAINLISYLQWYLKHKKMKFWLV